MQNDIERKLILAVDFDAVNDNLPEVIQMDSALRRIGKIILEKERECLNKMGRGLKEGKWDERYPDTYFGEIGHNLWAGVDSSGNKYPHLQSDYAEASGGELKDGRTPAKMKSIRSSSAMTYNLLGNNSIELVQESNGLSKGKYKVEYEKQLYTIRRNLQPANLDAYLYKEDGKEAIFCEMKMLEWLSKPNSLKDAYLDRSLYFADVATDSTAVDAFQRAITMLKRVMPVYSNGHHFYRYDAWQMFKHTLGIYNMTSAITRKEIMTMLEKRNGKKDKMRVETLPEISKATLVNVTFEPPASIFPEELQSIYAQFLEFEQEDFRTFKAIMLESGIIEVFNRDCGIDFDIIFMNSADFMDCFELGDRKGFLERYRLEKG